MALKQILFVILLINCGYLLPSVQCEEEMPPENCGLATSEREHPWLVFVYYNYTDSNWILEAMGSLVSSRYVMTDASNMIDRETLKKSNRKFLILVGRRKAAQLVQNEDLDDGYMEVDKSFINPDVRFDSERNNLPTYCAVGIHRLKRKLQFTPYVQPVCLWEGNIELSKIVGKIGTIYSTDMPTFSDKNRKNFTPHAIKKYDFPVIEPTLCAEPFQSDASMCVGDPDGGLIKCANSVGSGFYMTQNGRTYLRGIWFIAYWEGGKCDIPHFIDCQDTAQMLPWIKSIVF